MFLFKKSTRNLFSIRDVTAGATGATAVAPKFPDPLTLFQPRGADSVPRSQRSHQKFLRDYISVTINGVSYFRGQHVVNYSFYETGK